VVARHAKGGKMLEKRMEEKFGNVEVVAKKGGFRVYVSKKE
jgi:16S rRNA G1207 methylase RsmC